MGNNDVAIHCTGNYDLLFGTNFLSALHLYFAFGEKTLYFTSS